MERADDPLERQADHTADAVLAGRVAPPLGAATPTPQRMCAECEAEEELQLKAEPGGLHARAASAAANVVSSGGTPLSPTLRSYFEPRFGRDLSSVRIHHGPPAAVAARAINARAFTFGRDIAFARGEYVPDTGNGLRLLAHELAHVAQQQLSKLAPSSDDYSGLLANLRVVEPEVRSWQFPTVQRQYAEREREVVAIEVGGKKYVLHQTEVRTGGSSSWLANNPGNMDYTKATVGWGAYKGKWLRWGKHKFALFPSEWQGLYAVRRFLRKYQVNPVTKNPRNIHLMMNMWAPASDSGNKPLKYAEEVAKDLGPKVSVSTPLVKDLSDAQIETFAKTIKRVEGWNEGETYPRGDHRLPKEVQER